MLASPYIFIVRVTADRESWNADGGGVREFKTLMLKERV